MPIDRLPIGISNGHEFRDRCLSCQLPAAHTRAIKETIRLQPDTRYRNNIPLIGIYNQEEYSIPIRPQGDWTPHPGNSGL